MRLIFLGLLALCCISSALTTTSEGNSTEDSLADGSTKEVKVCIVCVTADQSEEEEEANPSEANAHHETSHSERKQKWRKKWLLRREKNRFMDHHHHHPHQEQKWNKKVRRFHERKNRWNEKKKFLKKIQYAERSSHTDNLNTAMDKMLEHFTGTLSNGNSTFTLRLDKPHVDMKIVPWTFVELEKTNTSNASRNPTAEAETADSDVEDNEDDTNAEEDSKQGPANTEDESQTSAEANTVKEDTNKATEDDNDDDDDDDDEEAITETSANVTCQTNNSTKRYYLTSKPVPVVLSNGAVEYNLKLLSEEEIKCRNGSTTEQSTELEDEGKEPKMSKRRQRAYAKRYSRRSFTRVEGAELIERNGDVMIGSRENSSIHVVDVQLKIGPITFIMNKKVAYPFRKSRVAFPALMARLRLKISEGQLMSARFKPKKIQPSEAIVTLQLKENEALISTEQVIAKLVGYLSQETTSAWNSGYLLRRLKGKFKQLYIGKTVHKKIEFNNEDARKLVELLTAHSLSSISDQQQPSAEHPTTYAPVLNELEEVEVLPSFTTSRPITQ
ncbi:uncharacterized protein LOC124311793 [Daphnia pulicaria]|uniref:uncharacterized protein LOC124311793 n=1 Tax=Daphnia pulicaria TaxID=35523 RepID=UPI001EEADC63|nr:uncharacterized protein LOC124311793 [Daphnia pulicaria]